MRSKAGPTHGFREGSKYGERDDGLDGTSQSPGERKASNLAT